MRKIEKIKENNKWTGNYTAIIRDADSQEVKRVKHFSNVILTQARERVNKFWAGELSDGTKMHITHEQLGYDDTATDESQTDLLNPEPDTKKLIASLDYNGDTIRVLSFWDEGEAVGDWKEFALYANSDFAVLRANVDLSISGGETITIDGQIQQEAGSSATLLSE